MRPFEGFSAEQERENQAYLCEPSDKIEALGQKQVCGLSSSLLEFDSDQGNKDCAAISRSLSSRTRPTSCFLDEHIVSIDGLSLRQT
jgi:hypothetical protein